MAAKVTDRQWTVEDLIALLVFAHPKRYLETVLLALFDHVQDQLDIVDVVAFPALLAA